MEADTSPVQVIMSNQEEVQERVTQLPIQVFFLALKQPNKAIKNI
jgi:hypothetical protein